jgi:hypothetical protein
VAQFIRQQRGDDASPFDLSVLGWSRGLPADGGRRLAEEMAEAGATWLQVSLPEDSTSEEALQRIRQGPPAP